MTGHTVSVEGRWTADRITADHTDAPHWPNPDDGVHLVCECGWDHNAGFSPTVAELAIAETRHHLDSAPALNGEDSPNWTRNWSTSSAVDAFNNAVFVFWICPHENDARHRSSARGEKVRWTDVDAGRVPVCMVCGETGAPR